MCYRIWNESDFSRAVLLFTIFTFIIVVALGLVVILPIALGYRSAETLELLGIYETDFEEDQEHIKILPSIFLLKSNWTTMCLGTLISADHILTSTQCVQAITKKNANNFDIRLYGNDNSSTTLDENRRKMFVINNDIAILKTNTRLRTKNSKVTLIELHTKKLSRTDNNPVDLQTITVKYLNADGSLDFTKVQLLTPEYCNYDIGNSTEFQKTICVKIPYDWSGFVLLGSPLLNGYKQIGFASNVTLCKTKDEEENQVLYTLVKHYGRWIRKYVDNKENNNE